MKLKKLFFVACNLFGVLSFAQVGINTTTPNALLDIRATSATAPTNTDGLLIPKVDVFPATNPTAAQQGMLVYLTTTSGSNAPGFYYWNNPTTSWVGIGGSASGNNWALAGNTVNATTDFMGSTNNADVIFKRNNIQSGQISTTNTSLGVNSLAPTTSRNRNTVIGAEAMYLNTASDDNTAVGYQALRAGSGARNVAIGNNTLQNTTGGDNTAVGMQSLQSNTTGNSNVAVGRNSLYQNTSGNNNTASGASSLYANTTGIQNTASGAYSLYSNTTGNYNTASGTSSLQSNTEGYQNTASGASSLQSNTTGSNNTGLGYNSQTGANLTNATAIGANASATTSNSLVLGSINGVNGATASVKVGIGTTAPNAALEVKAVNPAAPTNTEGLLIPRIDVFPATNPTAAQHGMQVFLTTAVGTQQPGFYYWDNPTTSWVGIGGSASGNNWALAGNTVNATTDFMGSTNDADVIFKRNNIQSGKISTTNTSLGVNSLAPATSRNRNTAIGTEAMYLNVNGDDNTAIGYQALRTGTNGARNVAIGNNTLMNTTGGDNTAVGMQSLQLNTTGNNNVAVGRSSLYQNTSGNNNSASGAFSLYSNTTGYDNTASGTNSLYSNTTGYQNTASGTSSLQSNTTGSNNTGLGYNSQTGANLTNATAIGANASATTSNSLVLGSINGVNGATASANVGIGTTAPNAALEVKAVNPAAPTNTEGLLIPRINVFPATNPTAAQHGMQVFLTTAVGTQQPGFYYWDNPTTSWVGIGGSSSTGEDWKLVGNNVTDANHFLGTTNWMSLKLKASNTLLGVFEPNGSVFLGSGATGNQYHSFTIGLDANASASESVSIGTEANSDGNRSQAIGYRARTTAHQSVAIGPNALASGASAIAIGDGSSSTQNQSMALGARASVTGNRSTALGYLAVAEDDGSLALGYNSTSKGNGSLAIGRDSSTNAQYSTAIGYKATTSQNNAIVLGDASDPLSKIGIGTSAPSEKLHVVGNIRIVDGNEANGKVLTSDADGKATWKNLGNDQAIGEILKASNSSLNSGQIALGTSNVNINVSNDNDYIQVTKSGLYKVTYHVNLQKNATAGLVSGYFYLTNWGTEWANTRSYFSINQNENTSVSISKFINLSAWQSISLYSSIGDSNVNVLANGTFISVEFVR